MCRYEVIYVEPEMRVASPVDVIYESENYTADDYIRDCMNNAEDDWCKMLLAGEIYLNKVHD